MKTKEMLNAVALTLAMMILGLVCCYLAYLERGYVAIGGEYMLIIAITGYSVHKIVKAHKTQK